MPFGEFWANCLWRSEWVHKWPTQLAVQWSPRFIVLISRTHKSVTCPITKAALSRRIFVLVRPGFEPANSRTAVRSSTNSDNRSSITYEIKKQTDSDTDCPNLCGGKSKCKWYNIGDFIWGNSAGIWQKGHVTWTVSNKELGSIRFLLRKKKKRTHRDTEVKTEGNVSIIRL